MAQVIRGSIDDDVVRVRDALTRLEADHPGAQATLYRLHEASIRARVFFDGFHKMNRADRHDFVWRYLEPLDAETLSQVSFLLPITRSEAVGSMANIEFENPITSEV